MSESLSSYLCLNGWNHMLFVISSTFLQTMLFFYNIIDLSPIESSIGLVVLIIIRSYSAHFKLRQIPIDWQPFSSLLMPVTKSITTERRISFSAYDNVQAYYMYRVFFLLVPPQKVLSVEDGKIPTKKVKVGLFNSKMLSFNSDFHFFCTDFVILNT